MNEAKNNYNLKLIEKFLRENFRRPQPNFWNRYWGGARPISYEIANVEAHQADAGFARACLLWIAVNDSYLDMVRLPVPKSWGLFALTEDECLHLQHQKPQMFSRLLQIEGDLSNKSALSLAELFCDAILSTKEKRHEVLAHFEALKDLDAGRGGYIFDIQESKRVEATFAAPELIRNGEELQLSFYTLFGSLNKRNQVQKISVHISKDYSITHKHQVITSKLFLSTPFYRA